LLQLVRRRQLPALLALGRLITPVHRACFLSAAASSGVLALLAHRPHTLAELAASRDAGPDDVQMLEAWLEIGVRLGDLERGAGGYRLRSWWSRQLAAPHNDTAAAALEEVLRFHHQVLLGVPGFLRDKRRLSLADQDGALIARATRVLEPFVEEAVDLVVPARGRCRLLEIGCGEGVYIRRACQRNPELTALGLELQPAVAEVARRNIAGWGLAGRVEIRTGDVRTAELDGGFDLISLHNAIYYFRDDERIALLSRLASLLAPGGRIVLTTGCRGGSVGLEAISLWFAASDSGGRLPSTDELLGQMRAAGLAEASARSLIPRGGYYAFTATRPHHEAA
jgi:4-hydroxy-2,2'-bipyrrole-5-carbaldehyde O-methyltransferase